MNHPLRSLLRYDLLHLCFERGRNSFRVWRASQFVRCRRFPVFLRRELDHAGSLTSLLHSPAELARAVAKSLYRGYRLQDLIIVEYCDTVDAAGIFRKYSAFIVGDTILPHTLMHSKDWITKSAGRVIDAATASEELDFVRSNPHHEWLRHTFAIARINYGRIDYGLLDGKPQVWEINTNPTIIRRPGGYPLTDEQVRLRDPVRLEFFPRFLATWRRSDSTANSRETIPIAISSRQRRTLAVENQRRLQALALRTPVSRSARLLVRSLRRVHAIGVRVPTH